MNEENIRKYMPHLASQILSGKDNPSKSSVKLKYPQVIDEEYTDINDIINDKPSIRHVRNYYRNIVARIMNEKEEQDLEFLNNFNENN